MALIMDAHYKQGGCAHYPGAPPAAGGGALGQAACEIRGFPAETCITLVALMKN